MREQKAAVHRRQNRQNNNFEDGEDQEDEWPEVDVNNLIIDLDIDIQKDSPEVMSGKNNKSSPVLKEKDQDKANKMKVKRSKDTKDLKSAKVGAEDRVEIIGESRDLKSTPTEKSSSVLNGLKLSSNRPVSSVSSVSRSVSSVSSVSRSLTTSTPTMANSGPPTQLSTVNMTNGVRPPFPPGYRPPMPPNPPGAPGYGGGQGGGGPPRQNLSQQARLSLYGGSALREALEQPPLKRLKVEATTMTDAATITEPESLGPCEPGTAVTLEGIVWHETMEGILVVNVTWRGKTYVGTLLDCARHSNQWSAPRFTESPPPKGKRGKRGARNPSPEIEMTVAKNLRSRKGQPNEGFAVPASPAKEGNKRKKEPKEGKSKKAKLAKVKQEEEEEIKIVTSDDNDEKPVVIEETFECPQPDCFKKYKAQSGLKYHISHAHTDTPKPAKDRINGVNGVKSGKKKEKESGGSSDSSGSQPSSGATSPSPDEAEEKHRQNGAISDKEGSVRTAGSQKQTVSPNGSKPIVSNQNHGSKNNNMCPGPAQMTAAPTGKTDTPPKNTGPKPIRPPLNARPIVPAQAPRPVGQLAANHMAPNLKPIQPKPTILPDPTPNVSFDDLKKKKEPKKKLSPKSNGKGGQSPKSAGSEASQINSPSTDGAPEGIISPDKASGHPAKTGETRNAYSDISDEGEDMEKRGAMNKSREGFPGTELRMQINNPANQLAQGQQPPSTPTKDSLPAPATGAAPKGSISTFKPDQKEISSGKEDNKSGEDKVNEGKKVVVSGPPAGTPEYYRMLEAYGFPPYPYPFPNGMDPNYHLHLLATDPNYKVKFEKDREEKARAFKDQIDKDNREKDLKTGVKVPTNLSSIKSEDPYKTNKPDESGKLTPKLSPALPPIAGSPTISVKAEFRTGKDPEVKKELGSEEGAKPTMETRGPPPGPQTYGFMSAAPFMRPPFGAPPFDPRHPMFASPNPMQMLGGPYGPHPGHPYFSPHGVRPPYPDNLLRPPSGPEDLSRSNGSKALEMLQQHASQYYSNHKIHELNDTKSPVSQGPNTPNSIQGKPLDGKPRMGSPSPVTKEKPSPPPPFRHEHTHTHLHLGYPLPIPGVPPPAHSTPMSSPPFSSAR